MPSLSLFGSPLTKTREKSRKDTRFKVLSACIILIRLSMEFWAKAQSTLVFSSIL